MNTTILGIIGSVLLMITGIWKYFGRKAAEQRKQAEQAKKDMENAKKDTGTASDLLDSFGRFNKR